MIAQAAACVNEIFPNEKQTEYAAADGIHRRKPHALHMTEKLRKKTAPECYQFYITYLNIPLILKVS